MYCWVFLWNRHKVILSYVLTSYTALKIDLCYVLRLNNRGFLVWFLEGTRHLYASFVIITSGFYLFQPNLIEMLNIRCSYRLYVTRQPCSRQTIFMAFTSLQERSYDYLITLLEIGKYAVQKTLLLSQSWENFKLDYTGY